MKKLITMVLVTTASVVGGSAMAKQGQTPLVQVGIFKAAAGKESAFKRLMAEALAATRTDEGCISVNFYQSINDPTEFSFVETWRSQADIDKHEALPQNQAFRKNVEANIAPGHPPIVKTYRSAE